jgi:hypothetical protein
MQPAQVHRPLSALGGLLQIDPIVVLWGSGRLGMGTAILRPELKLFECFNMVVTVSGGLSN